jgi:hypothetical protein
MTARVIVAIDPSAEASGLATLDPDTGRVEVRTMRAPLRDAARAEARAVLEAAVAGRLWLAAVERPLRGRWAFASPPTAADAAWRALLDDVAAAWPGWTPEAIVARRTLPVLRPRPSDWRAPLGLPTRPRERAKAAALAMARLAVPGLGDDDDAAEAVCLAAWAARQAQAGAAEWRPVLRASKARKAR